jgi:hypothetical protein
VNHSLTAYWISNDFRASDKWYTLYIKNDSDFLFEVMYMVYDGVAWDSISGIKTYTGKYHTDGNKLILNSDSMFVRNNLNVETIDTIVKNQTIFEDCKYQITGNRLQIDYMLSLNSLPAIKKTMNFYILTY